jgi:hypothetical protein
MPTAKDSRSDDAKPDAGAPTRAQFESFASRLLTVSKKELDGLIALRKGQRKHGKIKPEL